MLLKLELDSNYSLQAIVLMLLQFLLGNQTQTSKIVGSLDANFQIS
jgi:hypothetical protein